MANPAFGFNSYMQFARDATWGQFPTITKRFPIYSANAKALAGRIRPATMDGTLIQPALVAGMQMCQLELSMPVNYTGQLILWDLIMGTSTYASSGGVTTGSDPWTHTWATTKNLLNSGSFEIIQGNVPTSKCIRCTGMKVQKATLKCSAGIDIADQIMRMDLVLIGYALTENETPTGAITSPTMNFVLSQHMSISSDFLQGTPGTAQTLDWELVIDTMAKERPFLEGVGYISEPQRERRGQWTLSMTREYQERTALTAFLANTAGTFTHTFTSGGLSIAFSGTGAMPSYPENDITDEGWIKQKIVLEGQTASLSVVVVNMQATITT